MTLFAQVEDFLEKSTREERQGLTVEGVPDADLFFEDKVGAASEVNTRMHAHAYRHVWQSRGRGGYQGVVLH